MTTARKTRGFIFLVFISSLLIGSFMSFSVVAADQTEQNTAQHVEKGEAGGGAGFAAAAGGGSRSHRRDQPNDSTRPSYTALAVAYGTAGICFVGWVLTSVGWIIYSQVEKCDDPNNSTGCGACPNITEQFNPRTDCELFFDVCPPQIN